MPCHFRRSVACARRGRYPRSWLQAGPLDRWTVDEGRRHARPQRSPDRSTCRQNHPCVSAPVIGYSGLCSEGANRLRAISSAGERFVHTEEVTGSIPVSPTTSSQVRGCVHGHGPGCACPAPKESHTLFTESLVKVRCDRVEIVRAHVAVGVQREESRGVTSIICTALTFAPELAARDAAVCRRSWGVIVGKVGSAFCALLTAGAKTRGRNRLTVSTAPWDR